MTNWAARTNEIEDNGFGEGRNGASVKGVIIHHAAGTDARDYVANSNSRNSHPTYHISRSGIVTGIVHPNRRPFSTANDVDEIAVTFEVDNKETGGEWPITDESMEALLRVIQEHGAQSGLRGFAKNIRGKDQSEFFVGYHSQYVQTACPGPYITNRIDQMVDELNRRAGAPLAPATPIVSTPASSAPAPAPTNSPVGPIVRSGSDWAYRRPAGDLAKRVARALIAKGRLAKDYNNDGDPREVFDAAVQVTLNFSGVFKGNIDGQIERGGSYGVQDYAIKFGDYSQNGGARDGRPEGLSWSCFALGLERP